MQEFGGVVIPREAAFGTAVLALVPLHARGPALLGLCVRVRGDLRFIVRFNVRVWLGISVIGSKHNGTRIQEMNYPLLYKPLPVREGISIPPDACTPLSLRTSCTEGACGPFIPSIRIGTAV